MKIESGVLKLNSLLVSPQYASYIGALIADYFVDKIIETQQSFSFESVLSHGDKISKFDLADKFDYTTYLYFVLTSDPKINVERVKSRVAAGGHDVPEDRILKRYPDSIANLKPAALKADKIFVFDNTGLTFDMLCFIDRIRGNATISSNYPNWLRDSFDPDRDL